jgi:hypothetical protein
VFDVPVEWLGPDVHAIESRHERDDDGWVRSLANDVNLLSRREWPKARVRRDRRHRLRREAMAPLPIHATVSGKAGSGVRLE